MYLEVITGPVGAGKSAKLILEYRTANKEEPTLCITGNPQHTTIESRNGESVPAFVLDRTLYGDVIGLIKPYANIFIDEAQFIDLQTMREFVKYCLRKCATDGWALQLFIAGIDTTAKCLEYSTRTYPTMEWLLTHADEVTKLRKLCPNQRGTRYSMDMNPDLDERNKARYEGVCAECFFNKRKECSS
jgi:thymidine kinase